MRCCGRVFKNKCFGAAATALDSQVWNLLPEGSGLYTVAFLEGSFPKHQELFPVLSRCPGSVLSLPCTPEQSLTGGGQHRGSGLGADKHGRFSEKTGDPRS